MTVVYCKVIQLADVYFKSNYSLNFSLFNLLFVLARTLIFPIIVFVATTIVIITAIVAVANGIIISLLMAFSIKDYHHRKR